MFELGRKTKPKGKERKALQDSVRPSPLGLSASGGRQQVRQRFLLFRLLLHQ